MVDLCHSGRLLQQNCPREVDFWPAAIVDSALVLFMGNLGGKEDFLSE